MSPSYQEKSQNPYQKQADRRDFVIWTCTEPFVKQMDSSWECRLITAIELSHWPIRDTIYGFTLS
jgi:hypothetical protein